MGYVNRPSGHEQCTHPKIKIGDIVKYGDYIKDYQGWLVCDVLRIKGEETLDNTMIVVCPEYTPVRGCNMFYPAKTKWIKKK